MPRFLISKSPQPMTGALLPLLTTRILDLLRMVQQIGAISAPEQAPAG